MDGQPGDPLRDFELRLKQVLSGTKVTDPMGLDAAMQASWLKMLTSFSELLCLPEIQIEQLPHQIQVTKRVLGKFRGRAILADEVGLGKSIEAGMILKELALRSMVKRALILAPPSLISQWQQELSSKFGLMSEEVSDAPKADARGVFLISATKAKREGLASVLANSFWDLIIFDEAHHLKNRQTTIWRFVSRLRSKYLLLLTATPVQNSLEDIFNLITLIKPGQLGTAAEFQRRFVVKGSAKLTPRNVPEFRALLSDVMVRTSRAEAGLVLPPRQARTLVIDPTTEERRFYTDMSIGLKGSSKRRLSTLMGQRMMGSLPKASVRFLKDQGISTESYDLSCSSKLQYLLGYLDSIWDSAPNEKVLLFTQFTETHEMLVRTLSKKFPLAQIKGGQTATVRDKEVQRFREDTRLLISTDVGSEGKNLQFCRHLVNFDIPWNPMRIEQRLGRLHRFGQKEPVIILNLCQRGSIEEVLLNLLDAKLNMFEMVVGELDSLLGDIEEEKGFEEIVGDLWLESPSFDVFSQGIESLSSALIEGKRHQEKIVELDSVLFEQTLEKTDASLVSSP